MPRVYNPTISMQPELGDTRVWRHYGDGTAALVHHARIEGYSVSDLDYFEVAVNDAGRLQVDVISGAGGGTQYTEGETDASITGTAIMWEDAGNALVAVSAAKPLPVDLQDASVAITAAALPLPSGAATDAKLDTIIASLATVDGHVDGIEALLTSIGGYVDGLEGYTDQLEGYVDGIEGLLGTSNTNTGNIATSTGLLDDAIKTDDAGYTAATDKVMMIGGFFDNASTDSVDENDAGALRMSANRVLYGMIRDAAGNERGLNVSAENAILIAGDVAHDTGDSGNPIKIGAKALAHGSNPTGVTANDRVNAIANRAGVPFVIGGHPYVRSWEYNTTGAQTDDNIMATISGGTIFVITAIEVTLSKATTVNVGYRIGFGTSTLTAKGASGADAIETIVSSHPALAPGSGLVKGNGAGIIGIGADGAELRITNDAPTSGELRVVVTGYTIES